MDTSKLLERKDFRQIELDREMLELTYDAGAVEQDIRDLKERFLTIETAADGVRTGDIVIIDLPAEGDLEAETIHVNVGKRFYDETWEEELLGRTARERVTLAPIDGGREGTLRMVKRRVLPTLSDELVQRAAIKGVDTVDDYRQYMQDKHIRQMVNSAARQIAELVLRKAADASTFGDIHEEAEAEVESLREYVRQVAAGSGGTYGETLVRITPPKYDTPEKAEAYICEYGMVTAKAKLYAAAFAEADGVPFDRETYEKRLARRVAEGESRETLEESYPYESYLAEAATVYCTEKIRSYFVPLIKATQG